MAKHNANLAKRYANHPGSIRPVVRKHVRNRRKAERRPFHPLLQPVYRTDKAEDKASTAVLPAAKERQGKPRRESVLRRSMRSVAETAKTVFANIRRVLSDVFQVLRDELINDPGSFFRKIGFHIVQGVRKLFSAASYLSRYVLLPLSVAMVVGVMALFSAYTIGVEVTLDGERLGYMEDRESFEQARVEAEKTVSSRIDDTYRMADEPVYRLGLVPRSQLSDPEEISDQIAEISTDRIGKTYALYVDGQIIGTYPNEKAINEMLENLKSPYVTGIEDETVDFNKDVSVEYGIFSEQFEMSIREMRNKILSSDSPVIEYSVREGDTVESIANAHEVDGRTLENLNPSVDFTALEPNQRILIPGGEPLLSVVVRRTVAYTEEIPYDTTTSESSDMWRGMEQVVTQGEVGEKEIVADLLLVDGVEISREIISENVVKEPVTEVRLIGTKKIVANASGSYGSGNYQFPVNGGLLTANFADWRGDHYHGALDIAAPYGTEIHATDSGQVIYAGWSGGGHGYNVWIDHGNGITSRYSHCSAVLVETGQMVGQGQPICLVGATGNANGNHVHFVIQINGSAVDPLPLVS